MTRMTPEEIDTAREATMEILTDVAHSYPKLNLILPFIQEVINYAAAGLKAERADQVIQNLLARSPSHE